MQGETLPSRLWPGLWLAVCAWKASRTLQEEARTNSLLVALPGRCERRDVCPG